MSLLSRHVLRSLAAPFGWGVVALTGMLLLNSLSGLIEKLGGKGLPWYVMTEAIALALPALMVLTLPMAVLTATLYAYGQLAADMELVAMYANGISVWRMARPALIAAGIVAAVNFILFDQLVPRSNARYKALLSDVGQKYPTLSLQPRQLNLIGSTSYVLVAEVIDSGNVLRKVTIYDLGDAHPQRVIHADSGFMAEASNGTDMFLTLHQGEIVEFGTGPQGRNNTTAFQSDRFRLRDVTNKLNLRGDMSLQRGDREMSGCELLDGVSDQQWYLLDGTQQRQLLTQRNLRRLAGLPALPPPAVQLKPKTPRHCGIYRRGEDWLERRLLSPSALAAMVADSVAEENFQRIRQSVALEAAERERKRNEAIDQPAFPPLTPPDSASPAAIVADSARTVSLPDTLTRPQIDSTFLRIPRADDSLRAGMVAALNPPGGPSGALPQNHNVVATWLEFFGARQEVSGARTQIAAFTVEYHKKWAIPLSSFCFVLLGLALALRNPRGGIGLVIGGSLIIFMIFYILIIGGENLAKRMAVDPVLAIQGPLICFTLFGLYSVARANREMGSARGGSNFLDRIRDLFDRIRDLFGKVRSVFRRRSPVT